MATAVKPTVPPQPHSRHGGHWAARTCRGCCARCSGARSPASTPPTVAARAAQVAIDLARLAQDLRLRHQPPDAVDLLRFDTWLAQMLLDVRERDVEAVRGDFFAVDYVRERVRDSFDEDLRAEVDLALEDLLESINEGDLGSVRAVAASCGARSAEHQRKAGTSRACAGATGSTGTAPSPRCCTG